MSSINSIVNEYGPIIAATSEETPCGNNYIITWNEKETFHLFIYVPNNYYNGQESDYEECDVRTRENHTNFSDAKYFAQKWLQEIINQEQDEVNELLAEEV